ncbi:MAG: carboxymuconolactone decarboxylase family protein [Gammaproteobacteria bacterium]|nr:carboxymuconolactone decarboxylase family protein [Gammaproteobacteria bacterium]
MSVSYVELDQADARTQEFYGKATERFEMLLNIFKVFGHTPELGEAFTQSVMAMLKDGELDWPTKELIILKATHRNECQYCVVQHETLSKRMGISDEKISDIGGDRYQSSPHFSDAEKALLDLTVQIGLDANNVSQSLWDRLHEHFSEPQIVEAVYVITQYIAISKFGDALGVELEPVFSGADPILHVEHGG